MIQIEKRNCNFGISAYKYMPKEEIDVRFDDSLKLLTKGTSEEFIKSIDQHFKRVLDWFVDYLITNAKSL
jgi:hypothetical protein